MLDPLLMKSLEVSNWNAKGVQFHVFNNQEELHYYLSRSNEGVWWREESGRFDFEQCIFNCEITQWKNSFTEDVWFVNAEFKETASFKNIKFKGNADFTGCRFIKDVNFQNAIFEQCFQPPILNSAANFTEAQFKLHTTFSGSFGGFANFSKVTFNEGVTFDECVFKDELYLHGAVISDNASFENVEFQGKVNGWDLSCIKDISFKWANFRQKANFSDLKVQYGFADFYGANFEKNAYFYNATIHKVDLRKSVIEKNIYFLESEIESANRETWRIIKHEFIKQNNKIESLNYHGVEMQEYEIELFGSKNMLKFCISRFFRDMCSVFKGCQRTNKFIVFANRISNGNSLLPFRGVAFTIGWGLFFYILFLAVFSTENHVEYDYSILHLGITIKQFLQFLNLTDWKFKPYGLDYEWAYIILFFGRIFIGFGIYQTIQAFRKYGSS